MKLWKVAWWSNGEPAAAYATSRVVCAVVEGRHGCDGSPHSPVQPVSEASDRAAEVVQEVWHNLSKMCYYSEAHIS